MHVVRAKHLLPNILQTELYVHTLECAHGRENPRRGSHRDLRSTKSHQLQTQLCDNEIQYVEPTELETDPSHP